MAASPPQLAEFRLEFRDNGLVHIVFDAPGRTMNVFSEGAIGQDDGLLRGRQSARDLGGV